MVSAPQGQGRIATLWVYAEQLPTRERITRLLMCLDQLSPTPSCNGLDPRGHALMDGGDYDPFAGA